MRSGLSINFKIISSLLLGLMGASIAVTNTYASTANAGYFKAVAEIKKLPPHAVAVRPCTTAEKKMIIQLVKQNKLEKFGDLKLNAQGQLANDWDDEIEVYKGDFDNSGATAYAFVTRGGSMRAQTVTVYKQVGNQLLDLDFSEVVMKNLIPGQEMNEFYKWVSDPFAMTKDGKTYLRFMNYPGTPADYDKTKLQLCTYLWQKNNIILTGPNKGPSRCIGAKR